MQLVSHHTEQVMTAMQSLSKGIDAPNDLVLRCIRVIQLQQLHLGSFMSEKLLVSEGML